MLNIIVFAVVFALVNMIMGLAVFAILMTKPVLKAYMKKIFALSKDFEKIYEELEEEMD
jgi:hypothetical protein